MKKASILLLLPLTALLCSAATDTRSAYCAGYRIGDSDVIMEARITPWDYWSVYNSGPVEVVKLEANKVAGQKIARWWAYRAMDYTGYIDIVNLASDVYSFDWTYDTASYSPAFVVVDYDYITYNLSYNANGGSGKLPSSENSIVYTNSVEISSNELSRTGYTWSGWINSLTNTVWMGGETVTGSDFGVDWYADGSNVVLYAKWRPHAYTVKFNKNTYDDVSGEMLPISLTYDVSTNLTSNAFVRVGYKFSGWACEEDGQVVHKNSASVANLTSDDGDVFNLYAVWSPKKFSVRYHRNDGSGKTTSQGNQSYDNPTELLFEPPRAGYTFVGWATTSDGEAEYEAGKKYSIDPGDAGVINLYAIWMLNKYTVKFYANGGDGGNMSDQPFEYDTPQELTSNAFTKTGYSFAGWAKSDSGSVTYTDGQVVSNLTTTAGGIVILYAKWTANKYTVTLDKQGGDGGTSTVTNTYDSAMQRVDVPTRIGYAFGGYYDAENGGGTQYYTQNGDGVNGQNWDKASDATLYAKWTANAYSVKFRSNGGAGTMGDQSFTYDTPQELTANAFTKKGYSFAGWATNSNGTVVYTDGEFVSNLAATASASVYLYAKWTPNDYKVTLSANGGAVDPTSVDVTYDDAWPTLPTPTLDGYAFAGWYDDAEFKNATRTNYNVAVTNGTTIYAKWMANHYEVSFTNNSAEAVGNMQNEGFAYGEEKALTSNAFARVGYTFAGWATSADGQVEYTDGQIVSNLATAASAVVPLFAAWTPIEYTIAFDGNGADNPDEMAGDSIPVAYDAVVTLPESKFVKQGRSFKAWRLGDVTYGVGDSVSNLTAVAGEKVTFSAVWSELRYASFDGNGADNADAMVGDVITFDGVETKNLIPNRFEKTGYTFGGWATNETDAAALKDAYADGADVVSTNLWMGAGKTNVFYAVWQTNTYTVVFKPNGGNGNMAPQTFVYDQPQQLNSCDYENLNFAGWATNSTGEIVFTNNETVVNLTAEANGTVTLYAVWDNGDLSKAMHCNNLVWTSSSKEDGPLWEVAIGPDEGYNSSGSSVSNCLIKPASVSSILKPSTSSAEQSGMLSFWYRTSNMNCWLKLAVDGSSAEYTEIDPSTEWTQFGPTNIINISKVNITFNRDSGAGSTVWIDQMTWVPDGVEPTEDDKPVISGFAAATTGTGPGFAIQISNASDSFDYQILATNDLTATGEWPVVETLTGAEMRNEGYTIVVDEDEPKMFYKVKVISK